MAPVSRTAQFAKVHKVLKKYYKPVAPPADRPVLEHLLFACCLEDARYDAAEEAFAGLVHTFFDWNEVRVTSISELSEAMAALPDPRAAANRLKRVLHGVFEELYSFDLEDKRKKNLGPTVKWLERIDGTTKFSVAYVVQAALGGHAIPVDAGTLAALGVVGLVTDADVETGEVPGLERAVTKSRGVEFASLLHQLGADFAANPFSPQLREILLAIDPDAAERFPQRRLPRPAQPAAAPQAAPAKAAPDARAAPPPPAAPGRKKKVEAAGGEPHASEPKKPVAPPQVAPPKAAPAGKRSAMPAETPPEKHDKPAAAPGGYPAAGPAKPGSPAETLAKRKPR
jgi:endonuclease-3